MIYSQKKIHDILGYCPPKCQLQVDTTPHITNSFTQLFVNNIKWPKQNSQTSITYPNGFLEAYLFTVAHNLTPIWAACAAESTPFQKGHDPTS